MDETQDAAQRNIEARKRYENDITLIDRRIEQYRIDGQRFLAGDLPQPPDQLREQIRVEMRRLQSSNLSTAGDSFRLNTLEARFHSLEELLGRRLREREEGKGTRRAERPELKHDAGKGVNFSQDGAVEALYKGLYLRGGQKNPSMDVSRFRAHLEKQVGAIRAKTGCKDIQFRVTEEDGKMKIKAKPIK